MTLILGSPRKQTARPVECIRRLTLISPPKQGLHSTYEGVYGLLAVAKLTGGLLGFKDTGKVRNQKVAKSRIAFIPILILVKKFIARELIHGCI